MVSHCAPFAGRTLPALHPSLPGSGSAHTTGRAPCCTHWPAHPGDMGQPALMLCRAVGRAAASPAGHPCDGVPRSERRSGIFPVDSRSSSEITVCPCRPRYLLDFLLYGAWKLPTLLILHQSSVSRTAHSASRIPAPGACHLGWLNFLGATTTPPQNSPPTPAIITQGLNPAINILFYITHQTNRYRHAIKRVHFSSLTKILISTFLLVKHTLKLTQSSLKYSFRLLFSIVVWRKEDIS